MLVKTVYISKVTEVATVFKNCSWFWCSIIVFVAFAATCSAKAKFHVLQEIPVHFLISYHLFLYQYIILHILEISNFRIIIIAINSFVAIFLREYLCVLLQGAFCTQYLVGYALLLLFSIWQLIFLMGYCSVWEETI